MKNFFTRVLSTIIGNIFTVVLIVLILSFFGLFSMLGSFFSGTDKIKNNSVLELTLGSAIKESSMEDEYSIFSIPEENPIYFKDILLAIKKAKEDDNIKGISLRTERFNGGHTQLADLRLALEDFKKSGKFVYSYMNNAEQSAYILNSVADSIYQNPLGMILLQGLSSEVMFFKNFGDKYGIDFQVIRHGKYKSAVEPYLREDLSPENREQLTLLLNDIWGNYTNNITKSRKITNEQLKTAVDSLVSFNPQKALEYKLVDKLLQEDEYENIIAKKLGLEISDDDDFYKVLNKQKVSIAKYAQTIEKSTNGDEIAVLYASGAILPGEGFGGIQAEVYKKSIRKIKNDDNIKALVLRINSPGGSAMASEEILYELRELHKVKPIIVSFGDIAASGGYYIAMEADQIFAQPNTITGSIGVLGMIPNAKKLANNIGITTEYVNTNQNSDFLKSPFNKISESAINQMSMMTESVYKKFVGHVMKNRKMTFEQVDSIAGGRVWSGVQAKKIGLIDSFGSLDDAIEAAAKKANLDEYHTSSYPFRKVGIEEYLEDLQQIKTSNVLIKQELGDEYYQLYQELKSMRESNGVQVRMPYNINIK